ncbi:hypothetical protein Kfla_3957 [Kribbella flavida DSM 17836]|uniref:ABC transporter n=1 Tax=Kribbella flavida (strain DSM 17836 / JCM 10339 / NBRC 14399) TaxID=479435 RepID=D2PR60_KRIFD|nr:hypothetical protein [Kribbella flavida]ADB33008.1 hypothetical protein Kfla_3957 [Kribbella flavida DSM 17836]
MSALYRYLLLSVLLSQRYLPPTLIFLAALAVGVTSDSGPLQSSYAFCVLAVLVCSTWLAVSVVNHEDPTQRRITLVTIGDSSRVLAVTVAVVLTWAVPLVGIGLVYPIVTGRHVVTAGALAVGAVAQLAAAMLGTAIGLLCSRLVIPRIGLATLAAAAALLAVLLIRWLSPIRPIMSLLFNDQTPGQNAVPVALLALLCAAVLALATLATRAIVDRTG